jgi:serine/threonine protein phosphatase PrpC
MRDAIRAAHVAICSADIDYGDGAPPGTTIVAALVWHGVLTVGWVGDSRAYWVADGASELCTTDHSWINDVVATGSVSMAEAMSSPLAHALTKCLGPLDSGSEVVQDYFPSAHAIESLVRAAGAHADPSAIARFLVCSALAEGGGDNVSVAVHALAAPRRTE